MTVIANLNKCLEPEAVALTGGSIADQSALYSVAISLKRIADLLESRPTTAGQQFQCSNCGMVHSL